MKPTMLLLFSHPIMSTFATPQTPACQASLSLTISQSCPSSCPLHQWCYQTISSSDVLFSFCPQSFPASGTFPMSRLFASGDQNAGALASASVIPMSIQSWFPLRLIAFISLLSRGLSGVFFCTTVQRHRFFGALPSSWSSFHSHSWPPGRLHLDCVDLCWPSNVSAFQHAG